MAIPVQILYTLRISIAQKFSVGDVFTVGIIAIIVAIIRVVSQDSSKKNGDVSTTWLILFNIIEGTINTSLDQHPRATKSKLTLVPSEKQL